MATSLNFKRKSATERAMMRSMPAKERSKSFRMIRKAGSSIRGALTGESRAERKARKAAERAAKSEQAPSLPPSDSDDEETVYGVDLVSASPDKVITSTTQERTLGNSPQQEDEDDKVEFLSPALKASPANALRIVLVLMDPATRRFELLQLEFDSTKAIVGDVLSQVASNVTEATLKEKTYTGICDRHGVEMINSMSLAQFCNGSEVALAIPEGTSSKECARLSKPILSDPNVISMLLSNGIDCSESHENTSRSAPVNKSSGGASVLRMVMNVLFIAALAVGAKFGHDFISSPLQAGDTLTPGMWRFKCGLLSFLPSQETWNKLALPESFDPITNALSCERESLAMSRDGVLTVYAPGSSVYWQMEGGVCAHDHPSCVDGLTVHDNGSLEIGGKQIKVAKSFDGKPELSPWPFADAPKVKVVKGRN